MLNVVAPMEVGICCLDIEALMTFYTQMLDFTHVSTIDVDAEKAAQTGLANKAYKVTRLQTPYGERLKLIQPEGEVHVLEPTSFILDRRGAVYLTFIVDQLDDLLNRLVMHGLEPMSGRTKIEVRPGCHLAFVRDPEGNTLEFVQYDDLASYRPDLTGAG